MRYLKEGRGKTSLRLWERGLLDANFIDPRVPCWELEGTRKFDGAQKFQEWTSSLGTELLREKGLLLDDSQMLYH